MVNNYFKDIYNNLHGFIRSGKVGLFGILLLVAAIPLTIYLAEKQQEIRQHASTNPASVTVDKILVNPGDVVIMSWNIQQNPSPPVTGAETFQLFQLTGDGACTDTIGGTCIQGAKSVGLKLYLNCQKIQDSPQGPTKAPPGSPIMSSSCAYQIPETAERGGSYIFRLFAADGTTVLGESNQFSVTKPDTGGRACSMLQPNCAAQGLAEQKTVNADGCEVITCIEGCTSDTDCNKDQRIEPKKCMRYQNFPGQCQPENIACAQVVTTACNPATACPQGAQCLRAQECVDFPNPCVVPPGWTTDTRPKPTPTEIPKPDKITANSITIDNETVIPDGNKQYTITMIGSDPSGGEYVGNEYVFTNIIDQNAQNYRGYIGWSNQNFPYWGNAFKTGYPISCTGGGFGAVFGGGYGAEYIKLISCTTKVSGYGRVTSFVVSYLPNFLSPAINYLDGFVAKAGDQSAYDGWKRFAKFSIDRSTINTPPTKITVLDTTIDKNSISANGSSQYTISVIAGAPGGGDTILDQQAFINLYSTYPNQDPTLYRGSFGWSLDNFPFNPADPYRKDHDEMDCKGGGKGVLFTGPNNMTFGKEYLKLLSCETTINTYNRKTDFHVVFNRNFSSPSANILWGFSATSTTVYDGWRPFNTFTLGLPDTNTPLSFTISLPGISTATAPQHLQRGVTVQMFNASNNNVGNKSGLVSFDNTNGTFQGSVDLGTDLPTGQYLVKVQMDNYLIKAIKNITTITIGAPTVIAPVTLTTGDLNMDNKIDILDYNIFVTCYGNKANSAVCQKPLDATTTKPIIFADINDDGVVDGTDYILFLKSLSVREGD